LKFGKEEYMSELEDVYGVYEEIEKREYNKEDYAEYKKEEKKQIYELMDSEAQKVGEDVNEFKKYLDNQSKFGKYSVGNVLLITAQMPQAMELKDLNSWANEKAYKRKFEKPVKIFEPKDSYMREDGSIVTNYNVKNVYDVSQVNPRRTINRIKFNDKILLKILLNSSLSTIKVVDEIPNTEKKAFYDLNSNTLFVARRANTPDIFYEITEALGKQEIGEKDIKDVNKAYCVSYMICKKYDIPTEKFDFSEIMSDFNGLDPKAIRAELEPIKMAIENIETRMSEQVKNIIIETKLKGKVR
jgi:hypothetical protein